MSQPTIPIKDVVVLKGRGREDFSKLSSLVESIGRLGLIHPIVVKKRKDGKWDLIAGERRLRSCIILGKTEIPYRSFETLDDVQLKEMELEENIQRKDLSWPEQIELTKQIDTLKREIYGSKAQGDSSEVGWDQEKTADLLGISRPDVSRQIDLAKKMEARPDIAAQVKHLPMSAAIKTYDRIEEEERLGRLRESGGLEISSDLMNCSCTVGIKKVSSETVDLIVTDIPYGIEDIETHRESTLDNQVYAKLLKDSDNMKQDDVIALMKELVPDLARVLKPYSHMYMFIGMNLYVELVPILQQHFHVRPMPLIWSKGRTTSVGRGYDYSPCSEAILFCTKMGKDPSKRKILAKSGREILEFKPAGLKERRHPFQKPLDLLSYLIKQSTQMGDLVLDTFAGSGATLVAAKQSGRRAMGFELDEGHYLLGQKWLEEEQE